MADPVNPTVRGASPEVGDALQLALSVARLTEMFTVAVAVADALSVTVSVAVKLPILV